MMNVLSGIAVMLTAILAGIIIVERNSPEQPK
jgi:hypothetical protein